MVYQPDWFEDPIARAERVRNSALGGGGMAGQTQYGPEQQNDPERAMRRQRLLYALASGLRTPNQGGGFLGGLASGFSGSVMGAQQFQQQRGEEYRQQQKDEAEQKRQEFRDSLDTRRLALDEQRVGYEGQRLNRPEAGQNVSTMPWYEALPDEDPRKSLYRKDATRGPAAAQRPDKLVQVEGPDGRPIYVPESGAAGMKPVRERSLIKGQERTALGYYNRAKSAEETIASLEDRISGMSVPDQFRLRFAPNIIQTPDQQVYRQAQRAFTEARLRKESGAAIPAHEYTNDSRTYFAQPGDSPETIQKKRAARAAVLNGMKFQTGNAYEEFYGEPNTPPGRAGTVEDLGAKYGF